MALSLWLPGKSPDSYVLNEDGIAVPERSLAKWREWMATHDHHIAFDQVGRATVSTIFLGIDYSWSFDPDAQPLLWETLIIGSKHSGYLRRYTSRDAALHGHRQMVARVVEDWLPDAQTDAEPAP